MYLQYLIYFNVLEINYVSEQHKYTQMTKVKVVFS